MREDCHEFRGTNAPDVHNGEVNNGDVNKVNGGDCYGEIDVDRESSREVDCNGIGGTTTTECNDTNQNIDLSPTPYAMSI